MRRAGRIIYNGAMVVSLLLCLGTVGVWVRSYWVSDVLNWESSWVYEEYRHINVVRTSRGGLQFSSCHCVHWKFDESDGHDPHYYNFRASGYPLYQNTVGTALSITVRRFSALGFEVVPEAKGQTTFDTNASLVARTLTLPLYFPTLLFALLPAHYFLRVRRRRRMASRLARGCCVFCGYDLRASAGRCPECGREAAGEAKGKCPGSMD